MEPIVARDTIRDLARAAADLGQHVHVANPYPPMSAAHHLFEVDYWAAVREVETIGEFA